MKTLALAVLALLVLLVGVWLAVRGGAGADGARVEPRTTRAAAQRQRDEPLPAGTRERIDAPGDERVGIDQVPPLRIDEPPRASTSVVPSADLARGREAAGAAAAEQPLVWSFADALEHELDQDGGLELALAFEAGRTPTPADPWRVRAWGASPGRAPAQLFERSFDGTRAPRIEIPAAALALHAQVYVLRADWRGEPARYLAVCARPGFERSERLFACPEEAAAPCMLTAYWGLGSDGSLAPRSVAIEPETPLRVDARYASLFPPP